MRGTGSFLPPKLLSNFDLEKLVETSDSWIVERTGIRTRHLAEEGEATSDLAYKASIAAMEAAKISPSQIDMILVATVSPDQPMPSTACVLQEKLGVSHSCAALDISAACSGFIYGLSIADQFIRSGMYRNILVVGAEVLHHLVNYQDRETCILFGDGAGAFVVSRLEEESPSQILSSHLRADGKIGDLFVLPAGGSRIPLSQHVIDNNLQYVRMKGREIFKHAVRTMTECCEAVLRDNELTSSSLDWLVPHQANVRILEAVAKHFSFPVEKVVVEIAEMGNTSAATIPYAFDKAVRDGRIKRGQLVMLTAFGAGITSGSLLLRY